MTSIIVTIILLLIILTLLFYFFPSGKTSKNRQNIDYHYKPEKSVDIQSESNNFEIEYSEPPVDFQPKDYLDVSTEFKDSILQNIKQIDAIPSSSFKTLNILDSDNSSSQDAADIIATDPILSGEIIKTVNSAFFNLPNKISALSSAILFLGFNNVKSIVVQQSLKKSINKVKMLNSNAVNQLWLHSSAVSACALHLGKFFPDCNPNDLATIGLLHDIGKYYIPLIEKQNKSQDIISIEDEENLYGINHALLGGMIAKQWGLPEMIVDAIEFHHHPFFYPPDRIAEPHDKVAFAISLADHIATIIEDNNENSKTIYPIRVDNYEYYNMQSNVEKLISKNILKEVTKATNTVKSYMTF